MSWPLAAPSPSNVDMISGTVLAGLFRVWHFRDRVRNLNRLIHRGGYHMPIHSLPAVVPVDIGRCASHLLRPGALYMSRSSVASPDWLVGLELPRTARQ